MSTLNELAAGPGSKPGRPSRRLTGKLSTFDIVFTVLAFNAPLSVFVGFIPVIIGSGNQLGAPTAYLAAGALILVFAVGFTSMGRHLPNPGAFYAYITAGLGKPLVLGASFLAIVSYFFILVGGYAFGGISLEALVTDVLGGPEVPWWAYTLLLMTIVGTLGYFKITLSAKILTVSMIFEVILMVAFDVAAFINGGPEGLTTAPFEPANMLSGNIGLALLFGIVCYAGFEATAVFREEARSPEKTVPRATYIAILSMGSIYALTAWAQIIAIGPGTVVEASATDPTGTVMGVVSQLLGKIVMDVMIVLLCSSIFAANLATHNISARYLYSLSVDRVFPAALSRVHSRHDSPHVASLATSVIAVIFLAVVVIAGAPGATLYAVLVGVGGYALILLLILTSAAVVVYFHKRPELKVNRWKSQVAPVAATLGLIVAGVLATQNIAVMIGGDETLAAFLMALFYGCLVIGIILALIFRRTKPDTYARIGRQEI